MVLLIVLLIAHVVLLTLLLRAVTGPSTAPERHEVQAIDRLRHETLEAMLVAADHADRPAS